MKTMDEAPAGETDIENNNREQENQLETSDTKSSLLSEQWKPYGRPRAVVKEWLLKLKCCFGAVCGMDWYGYAALGILTAFLSFLMDLSVLKMLKAHQWLYMKLDGNKLLQFFCWTLYPACLCVVSSSFSLNICPFSTGSGIPEVRTMVVGFEMPHYLSVTHMFTKYVGLICTLAAGSTIFLGKVGPFVHLSTMVGAYVSNLCNLLQVDKKDNTTREMLVVAAGVGVASCFGAPISGVLFSVEVMCSHFALKQYVPCFFSSACGALTFRLFSVWSGDGETLQTLFKTNFPTVLPFYPLEILMFAFVGLLCGAVSCCYLSCHRRMLQFTRTNSFLNKMLTTHKALYAGMVAVLLASVTFPHFAGQYMASKYTMKQLLTSLLDSRQWNSKPHNASVQLEPEPLLEWSSSGSSFYFSLTFFLLMKMWMLVLACSLPLPAGYFMPVFVYGAALGRLFAEGAAYMFSWGSINPGGYALAGAAAYSGAVTHTLSPALLAIEVTGEFSHAVPALLATLLANAVARSQHRPSFYDNLSIIKRLPHLPSLKKAFPRLPSTPLGQALGVKSVKLQRAAGPAEVQHAVNNSTEMQIPVVDSHESQILQGFVLRSELLMLLRHSKAETVEKHLDEVCCIHPNCVLLSPHNTVQEEEEQRVAVLSHWKLCNWQLGSKIKWRDKEKPPTTCSRPAQAPDPEPFSLPVNIQAFSLLSLAGAQTLFVTDGGRLVGFITWPEMKRILEELAKET